MVRLDRWRRGWLAVMVVTAGCPAPQVGHLEGPGAIEDPTMRGPAAPSPSPSPSPRPSPATAAIGDRDRDRDGVVDADDACPDLPELFNAFEDDDGCPDDPPRMVVPDIDPSTIPPVVFAAGSATITPARYAQLDALAALMQRDPTLKLVELQGHTDGTERGARLDVRRAEAVRAYLVERGVDPARLTTRGYGATRPSDPARTDAARARNRRVEASAALRVDDPGAPAP